MENIRKEIIAFQSKDYSIQFSKNLWLDLLVHALIGLVVGTVIFFFRPVDAFPVLLISMISTTLNGLINHLRRKR